MTRSFVLKALRIFGLEEMLKLSEIMKAKPAKLKKAAGEELIVWSDSDDKVEAQFQHQQPSQDNVLQFKKSSEAASDLPAPISDPHQKVLPHDSQESSSLLSSEFLLWQRELMKETSAPLKKDAVKGYVKSTEMYIVKTPTAEGKEKIRFASTKGVLVNKKQA